MISAVVILYYPNGSVSQNINSYLPFVDRLYVIDNSEKSQIHVLHQDIRSHKAFYYYHDGRNGGIAERLNFVCEQALSQNQKLLLTMDQDSNFDQSQLLKYIQQVKSFEEFSLVGMFGVRHYKKDSDSSSNYAFNYVVHLITSGSVINLANFRKIGGFDEKLFIDQVDFEFCLRLIKAHLKVVEFKGIYINHNLGNMEYHISLKNLRMTTRSLHSPIRLYYMVRNYFYTSNIYKVDFPVEIRELKKDILIRIKNNLLYGKKRIKLLLYISRALLDYKKKKMGKFRS